MMQSAGHWTRGATGEAASGGGCAGAAWPRTFGVARSDDEAVGMKNSELWWCRTDGNMGMPCPTLPTTMHPIIALSMRSNGGALPHPVTLRKLNTASSLCYLAHSWVHIYYTDLSLT